MDKSYENITICPKCKTELQTYYIDYEKSTYKRCPNCLEIYKIWKKNE